MARVSFILIKYISYEYVKKLLFFFFIFFCILLIARLLETLRATASKDIEFIVVFKIAFNKTPYVFQHIIPLVALFASISLVVGLNRRNEFVFMKASGMSLWQFIIPLILISFTVGIIFIALLNPIISTMYNISENYQKKYLGHSANLITVTSSNIWLKEEDPNEKKIIRAKYISANGKILEFVTFYILDKEMNFLKRIEAREAEIIKENVIELKNGYIFEEGALPIFFQNKSINIQIASEGLQEGFSQPGAIALWELPKLINLFKRAGFSAIRHQIYFVSITFIPIQLMIYTIIGVICSVGLTRSSKYYIKVVVGIILGLGYFFATEIISTMSLNFVTPVYFTLAIPIIIVTLILIFILLHMEES